MDLRTFKANSVYRVSMSLIVLLSCLTSFLHWSSKPVWAQNDFETVAIFSNLPLTSPGLFTLGYQDKATGGVSVMAFSLSYPITEADLQKMESLPFRLADTSSVIPRLSNLHIHKIPDTMRPGVISPTIDDVIGARVTMVLGRDFLNGKVLSMDVDGYMLSTHKLTREATSYPAQDENNIPVVQIEIAGQPVKVEILLDGDVDLILTAELFQTLFGDANLPRIEQTCTYELADQGSHIVNFIPTLRIGNIELSRTRIAISKDGRNRICLPLLRRLEAIIEIDASQMVLKVPVVRKRAANSLFFWEFAFEIREEGLLVTRIPNWSIFQDHFAVGDIWWQSMASSYRRCPHIFRRGYLLPPSPRT